MRYLLDTNVLVRLTNHSDPQHSSAATAVSELHRRGATVFITPQNMVEFRNVCTRPVSNNGLGYTAAQADLEMNRLERVFPLLPEIPTVYSSWKFVVTFFGVLGKQVHDARLVAVCHAHAITHLLTFNMRHLARYSRVPPHLIVVDPTTIQPGLPLP